MMPTARVLAITALFGLIPLQSAIAAGSAYKWIDADGEVHYSQTPPPATDAKLIKTPTGSAATPPPAAAPADPRTETATGAATESAQAEDAAIREKNCSNAHKNMEILKGNSEVVVKDANGLMHTLTPEERETRIQDAEKVIQEFCK